MGGKLKEFFKKIKAKRKKRKAARKKDKAATAKIRETLGLKKKPGRFSGDW